METNHENADVVLASASPRRCELLQQIGLRAYVHPVDIDEQKRSYESSVEMVKRLALEKARAGHASIIEQGIRQPVIGADTIVELNGDVLGKPKDASDASQMLGRLSGRVHQVHTAVSVVTSYTEFSELSSSSVEFAQLSPELIDAYIASGEPMDKAGAYGIQGLAARFVKKLEGSYSGVMGLPLYETARALAACGVASLGDSEVRSKAG